MNLFYFFMTCNSILLGLYCHWNMRYVGIFIVVLYFILLGISHLFFDREPHYVSLSSWGNGYWRDKYWWEL